MGRIKPKCFSESFKSVPRQWVCKPICHLVSSGHIIEFHIAVRYSFPNIVMLYGGVLGSGVVPKVPCKGYKPPGYRCR